MIENVESKSRPPSPRPVRLLLSLGWFLGAVGVVMGAVGSHVVSDEEAKGFIRLASSYQIFHALALIVSVSFVRRMGISQVLFLVGILLFCGGLSLYALTGVQGFRSITPYGGMALILAWISMAWIQLREG